MSCLTKLFTRLIMVFFVLNLPVQAAEPTLKVQALMSDKIMLEINGKTHMLAVGEASAEGVKLLRADSFEAVVEVNGTQRTLHLDKTISNRTTVRSTGGLLQIPADEAGMYLVDGMINGQNVHFLVDTGATSVAMNQQDAERLGIRYLDGEQGVSATAGGHVRTWMVTLNSVRVGPIEKASIKAAVLEGRHPDVILLGMTFLGHLDIRHAGRFLELRDLR